MKIYKNSAGETLHIIANVFEIPNRLNLTDEDDALQVSIIKTAQDNFVAPHAHTDISRTTVMSMETWIVMRGQASITLYDDTDAVIESRNIQFGDVVVTFTGGHSLFTKTDTCIIVECKNGPYINTRRNL